MLLQTLLRPLGESIALSPLVVFFIQDVPLSESGWEPLMDELDVCEDLVVGEVL